jgi:hypothetical protein
MNNSLIDTPAEVTEALTRWGGTNEYREPNWRIILAPNHLVQRAGMWTEFEPDVEQTSFEPGKDGLAYKQRVIAPDAIRIGIFWVPKYPVEVQGWVLERWFPPSAYGSRELWESALSQDNETPMMGPFPNRGGYFMPSGGGPWDEIPDLESIHDAIAAWENSPHQHGQIDEEELLRVMRNDMIESEEREQRQYDALLAEITHMRQTQLEFINGNPALSGFRNRLLSQQGFTSHH